MQNFYDYKKYKILYVDDELKSLSTFERVFRHPFNIITASSAEEGYQLLNQHASEIGILITDQRMPEQTGAVLLERARKKYPKIIRILATAFEDIQPIIDAVNSGAIYKYISKPWDADELEMVLKRAMEFFIVQKERDQLLKEKLSVLHNMLITDRIMYLGVLASGLSHHLRNSLVAVRTFMDLAPKKLKEELFLFDELRNPNFWEDFYEHVQGQVEKITNLLVDLGQMTEPVEAPYHDFLSPKVLLEDICKIMEPRLGSMGVTLRYDFPSDLPALPMDRVKFAKMLELLFKDELETLKEGNQIWISAKHVTAEEDSCSRIEIILEDDGPGLPEESLRAIFDPFFLRKDHTEEFAIHLMAAYFLAHHHGGKIHAQSRNEAAGSGMKLTLTFPLEPEKLSKEDNNSSLGKMLIHDAIWENLGRDSDIF